MDKIELWKQTRSRAIRVARQRAKDKAAMTHACGLMLHAMSDFGAIARGIQDQQHWAHKYSVWIDEMDREYSE